MAPPVSQTAKLTAEFVGTFMLVHTVGCNVLSGNAVWGGVSIASVLMVMIYALGGISGANFNPAVSLAVALKRQMRGEPDWKEMALYTGVQLVAGACAAFSYFGLFRDSFDLGPADGFSALQAGLCEFLYTFMLCFVVLNTATLTNSKNEPVGNDFYGLAIGFVIVAGAYGAGAVSGGCFNPAVAFGINASSFFKGAHWFLLYMVCEFCGAALAAVLHKVVRPDQFPESQTLNPEGQAGESPGPSNASKLVSEFLGTFMLVLTVGLNVLGKSPAGAFSIAASLMCMIYALGDVSGANFNPAVTVALFVTGNCVKTVAEAGMYIGVQLCGGILAGITYLFIRGDSFTLGPAQKWGFSEVATAEIVFTFVLCYVVLCVAVDAKTKNPVMFGLAIGACVTVGGNAIGAISGGSLNPAVSWGIATGHFFADGSLVSALLYTVFELLGAFVAVGVYQATHETKAEKKVEDTV